MGKTLVVLLMLGLLAACGGTSLDTKNAATFMRTFQEITADMGEAERLAYAGSILVIGFYPDFTDGLKKFENC